MPRKGPLVRPRYRIPETDGIVPTPTTSDCATIRAERDAVDIPRMPGEQGDLLMGGVRIVEPNTDASRHGEPGAVGRVSDFTNPPFAEARFGSLR